MPARVQVRPGKKLSGFDEQLADYFAKAPEAKLGILTNGITWRFFTDLVNANVMDKEPFVKWDVLADEQPPIEFLTVLQRAEYNSGLIRTYAQRTHQQNLLVGELTRLLEPSAEFTKMVITNVETRNLTAAVVESWKPVVAGAISEWAKQRALSAVIGASKAAPTPAPEDPKDRIVTTPEELDGFARIQRLLGSERPVAYEDTVSYFKVHLPEKRLRVVCRLYFDRKKPTIWVTLPAEKAGKLVTGVQVTSPQQGWAGIVMEAVSDLDRFGDLLRAAWDAQKNARSGDKDEA